MIALVIQSMSPMPFSAGGLGVTADARDELDIRLLSARLFAMRDKQLGTSLVAYKQAVVSITTA